MSLPDGSENGSQEPCNLVPRLRTRWPTREQPSRTKGIHPAEMRALWLTSQVFTVRVTQNGESCFEQRFSKQIRAQSRRNFLTRKTPSLSARGNSIGRETLWKRPCVLWQ